MAWSSEFHEKWSTATCSGSMDDGLIASGTVIKTAHNMVGEIFWVRQFSHFSHGRF